eukprot:6469718-Amphidinium_carterae.1
MVASCILSIFHLRWSYVLEHQQLYAAQYACYRKRHNARTTSGVFVHTGTGGFQMGEQRFYTSFVNMITRFEEVKGKPQCIEG